MTTYLVITMLLFYDLVATGWLGFNERIVAMCRNVVFPGLGFLEFNLWLTALFVTATVVVVAAWLRWGTDWLAGVVWGAGVVLALLTVPAEHQHAVAVVGAYPELPVLRSSHEFAAILVVVAALNRVRVLMAGLPGVRTLIRHRLRSGAARYPTIARAHAVDRARAAAIAAVAVRAGAMNVDRATVVAAITDPVVRRRARRVGACARWRFRGDPLRADSAHTRAALALWGQLSAAQVANLRTECRRHSYGVPASEPSWVRPLDGMLTAVVLHEMGESVPLDRWRVTFDGVFGLRHGRRRGSLHTPTMLGIGTAPPWEHAAATALARTLGWIGDDDWAHLRRSCLGAAARGARTTDDARLVAAGRVWAHIVGDDQALKVLTRPSRAADPIATALDQWGDAVHLALKPSTAHATLGPAGRFRAGPG